mgnify:CR=1 FL=1
MRTNRQRGDRLRFGSIALSCEDRKCDTGHDPAGRCLIQLLATDLDGTFLGGRQADRLALYRVLRSPGAPRLVFATGRGIETILPLLADPLIPKPDYIIADVGATVVDGTDLRPITPLQWEIDRSWIGAHAVLDAVGAIPELVRQPVPQERRVLFFIEEAETEALVRQRLGDLPVDVLRSASKYLDVLPTGTNKGSTLRRLIDYLGIPDESVLVAGDTLNDLSLYQHGFHGVVVGQAEPALVAATRSLPRVRHARLPGAGGILEVMRALDRNARLTRAPAPSPEGDAQLVVVYHRLPFEEYTVDGAVRRRPHASPNGIIPTLLGCFQDGRPGSWVAWTTQTSDGPRSIIHEPVDESLYSDLVVAKVPLETEDVERFYKRFSKEAFWPVIFSFVDRAVFRAEDWEHFCEVNRRFAEAAAGEADEGALVWIHDYNLWMVPAYLRQLRPDVKIGFFHHTSFPPADVFNVIPWASEIVGSLVQCDHIGFHIPRYAANFLDVIRSHMETEIVQVEPCAPRYRVHGVALAIPRVPRRVRAGDRILSLGVHPVGIDLTAVRDIIADPARMARINEIRERFQNVRLVVSIERLDYVKGPLQKLEAFERLLERHPEYRENVSLVFVTTPAAPGMEVYDEVRTAVDEIVGRINGRFGSIGWTPIHYFFRSLPFDEAIGYAAAADVAWITPLRDGLNLVAKEFVIAQDAAGGAGVLLLSEFAGAAVELHGALLTNPYDIEGMTARLQDALAMPEPERRLRMRRLARIVASHDVADWSREFLDAMAADPG